MCTGCWDDRCFFLNNILFKAKYLAAPDPQSDEKQYTQRERDGVSVCAGEEETEKGRRDTEINIQRRKRSLPPSPGVLAVPDDDLGRLLVGV